MRVRAKMQCTKVTEYAGNMAGKEITLQPVGAGEGNESWSRWTPSGGEVRMFITNPTAADAFKPGAFYFVDFTPAD